MNLELDGKTALITGASVGIGLAIAEGLAAEGVNLVLVARNKERLDQEAARIADYYKIKTLGIAVNIASASDVKETVRLVEERFGGIDILINNAGTGSNETIAEATDEKWQLYWELHVMAAVRLARGFMPTMKRRGGGVILHNASICAAQPLWYEPIYNVTKAALMMFSKVLAHEAIDHNIRVNTVNPGLVLTPDWIKTAKELTEKSGGDWQAYLNGVAEEHAPIKRFASPKEIADFFVFLCSARASYSSGSAYYVDGGMLKTV
ncbi:SDR family NAD(P)-dependent oxidoreductase [Azomonas macrocytogenes]|uniref:NAD(P)-dependent dehydrogenase (Short-subunit alcohol dehydrogenase family) n=1 Tax=Azomonas macrocytogenes TaxID=69962 RepID=A0A839T4W1_AZOMA|nr:SDR family oxidoreductase [Azomonas macrocytogenes]MBB3104039.1 NAD(P)-dependent dehydrogenase (short-subunit alcohol dehydrogenase family) [Azomonas macrocytogenes]